MSSNETSSYVISPKTEAWAQIILFYRQLQILEHGPDFQNIQECSITNLQPRKYD